MQLDSTQQAVSITTALMTDIGLLLLIVVDLVFGAINASRRGVFQWSALGRQLASLVGPYFAPLSAVGVIQAVGQFFLQNQGAVPGAFANLMTGSFYVLALALLPKVLIDITSKLQELGSPPQKIARPL